MNDHMSKPVVITGEASETESEEDVFQEQPPIMTSSVKGAVISGEDSESEDENDGSISSAISALDQSHNTIDLEHDDKSHYDSLLHQKLRETNKKLYTDIEEYCQNLVENATKTLHTVDQKLLHSQVTLQGAVTSLKSLSSNSSVLKNKLQSLLSANFIPNISTNK